MPTQPDNAPQGNTIPAQGETNERVPKLPHERDESVDSQPPGEPSGARMGSQAHDDLADGQVDTGKRPPMNDAYEKSKKQPG